MHRMFKLFVLLASLGLVYSANVQTLRAIFAKYSGKNVEQSVACATKKCDSDQTCCNDDWDCCPVPSAVCCKDKGHCCPKGYICDEQPFICRWPDDGHLIKTVRFTEKVSSKKVKCDDERSCPDQTTCCQLRDEKWGCCPTPDAICCADGIHCCPKGTTCDAEKGRCSSKSGMMMPAFFTKLSAHNTAPEKKVSQNDLGMSKKPSSSSTVVRCDSTHYCPSGNTCCKLSSGQWGCCPVPNAVCCNDHVHCCPNGYTCSTGTGECTRGLESIPWMKKAPASNSLDTATVVQCDSTHYCPSGSTCCRLSSGQWGCCPVKNAVCCDDHVHCCPNGYTCSTGTGECTRGVESIPWMEKEPASNSLATATIVQCDSTHYCPSGSTCCRLSSGQWGCCPVPNAVCCNDHVHCCPNGYTCSTGTGQCTRGLESIPWMKKDPASNSLATATIVQCDSTHYCPSGSTCCKLSSGQWGCCPVPNAVCCDDHVHCCPNGYTCSTGTGQCTRGLEGIPWMEKEPASNSVGMSSTVQCDENSYCSEHQTCCKLSAGRSGCCPFRNAVCCEDQEHCCPSGFSCGANGSCQPKPESRLPIDSSKVIRYNDVRCDDTGYDCPDGFTCCPMKSGEMGCCPYENAVCCDDGVHCCPSGTVCNLSTQRCDSRIKGKSYAKLFVKLKVGRSEDKN